jgi:hypothetical protein
MVVYVEPAIAAAVAAGRVPQSVTVQFLMESRDAPARAAILAVTILTSIVVLLRCGSRALVMHKFGFDDGLALFSLVSGHGKADGSWTTRTRWLTGLSSYFKLPSSCWLF